jgi:hypothetical protein
MYVYEVLDYAFQSNHLMHPSFIFSLRQIRGIMCFTSKNQDVKVHRDIIRLKHVGYSRNSTFHVSSLQRINM